MPPLQALLALHGMWLLVFAPILLWAARTLQPGTLRRAGRLVLSIGVVGLVIVAAREAIVWLPSVPGEWRSYYPHRVLFSLAVMTEWPIVQAAAIGALCGYVGRSKRTQDKAMLPAHQPHAVGGPPDA